MKIPTRVFTIGNSFASNATEFLPQLAAEAAIRSHLAAPKLAAVRGKNIGKRNFFA